MQEQPRQKEECRRRVLLTVRDVASVLQISIASVYAMVAEGKLAFHRVGIGRGSIRFEEKDLEEYLLSCRSEKVEQRKRSSRSRLKHIRL